jgi:hypothetical protein
MAISPVSNSNVPPPAPQPESRESTRNGQEVRSDRDTDNAGSAEKAPPPDTSPQGKMVGSLVDTKA